MNEIAQLIMQLGFPIVACGALGWYVYKTDLRTDTRLQEMQNKYETLNEKVTDAITNNTIALNRLSDKLGDCEND